ncbi:hypothetical protein GH714_009668 [Hevea brasiliensis]|uniref:Uncharacterized protein n=1 Tax=Hevea brasiliensis TaxID=3981 RepID=A0A6A6KD18_HEVBR|nr:hypothetical protein GH714_009668 [Hevea brasiliensis]
MLASSFDAGPVALTEYIWSKIVVQNGIYRRHVAQTREAFGVIVRPAWDEAPLPLFNKQERSAIAKIQLERGKYPYVLILAFLVHISLYILRNVDFGTDSMAMEPSFFEHEVHFESEDVALKPKWKSISTPTGISDDDGDVLTATYA